MALACSMWTVTLCTKSPRHRLLKVCGPLAAHRIAVLAGLSRASVSSAVNTLERDGHVVRSREHDDRRLVTVSLTPTGEDAVRDAY